MSKNYKQTWLEAYSFFVVLILFFVDISSASLFEQPLVHAVLTFYIMLLLRKTTSSTMYVMPMLFLALENFFLYGRFDMTFIFLIPLIVCALYVQQLCHMMQAMYYLFLGCFLCLKLLLLEPYFLHVNAKPSFVICTLAINMLILWCFLAPSARKTPTLRWGNFR